MKLMNFDFSYPITTIAKSCAIRRRGGLNVVKFTGELASLFNLSGL